MPRGDVDRTAVGETQLDDAMSCGDRRASDLYEWEDHASTRSIECPDDVTDA